MGGWAGYRQKAHEKRSCELCAWKGCEHMLHKARMHASQLLAEKYHCTLYNKTASLVYRVLVERKAI